MMDEICRAGATGPTPGEIAEEARAELGGGKLGWKALTLLLLTALADVLFYGHDAGWTLGAFGATVLLAMAALNFRLLTLRRGFLLAVLCLGLCVALVEEPSALAVILLLAGLASVALADQEPMFRRATRWAQGLLAFACQGPVRPVADVLGQVVNARRSRLTRRAVDAVGTWLVPLAFAALFITLFGSANPVIDGWLEMLRLPEAELPPMARAMFWLAVAFALWSFLNPWLYPVMRWQSPAWQEPTANVASVPSILWRFLFSPAAIVRSLLMFNVLFAIQNGLDALYLWGGRELPDGFTYATYAHRGAYPLIVTALLAALFVLIAFRDGGGAASSPLLRRLMYLWIGQNVALVLSSIWRTVIYVEQYSLTYLRLSALIWMGLVAAGLVWLVLRFARGKTNAWLLNVNAATALGVLYVVCFADLGGVIADYNVRRCREVGGPGVHLDRDYLGSIGPSALPALRWYAANVPSAGLTPGSWWIADRLESDLRADQGDWRRWTFRGWRIAKRLDGMAVAVPSGT